MSHSTADCWSLGDRDEFSQRPSHDENLTCLLRDTERWLYTHTQTDRRCTTDRQTTCTGSRHQHKRHQQEHSMTQGSTRPAASQQNQQYAGKASSVSTTDRWRGSWGGANCRKRPNHQLEIWGALYAPPVGSGASSVLVHVGFLSRFFAKRYFCPLSFSIASVPVTTDAFVHDTRYYVRQSEKETQTM